MKLKNLFFLFFLSFSFLPLYSWTNHFLGSYLSLEELDEIAKAKPVKVESIESFLKKEADGVAKVLDEIEKESQEKIRNYPKKPDTITFDPKDTANLRKNFLRSIRINPTIKLKLFIQEMPGHSIAGKKRLKASDVTIFDKDEYTESYIFTELKEGGKASPLSVAASGADEPDYGHDIGLYQDNKTEFGDEFNFGIQPFGDPRLYYSSQAPFHMGFFHESGIINAAAAGYVKRTYPEWRVLQYFRLAKFAFSTGHDYWGYRFMGWAMHYLGDLTQPYHSTLLPGVGTTRALFVNFNAMIGLDGGKNAIIERLSDRHTAIEHYQYDILNEILVAKDYENSMVQAYKKTDNDSKYPKFDLSYPREVIAKESNERAEDLDDKIGESKYVMIFKEQVVKKEGHSPDEESKEVDKFINQMFISFGSHLRNFARETISK
ncbi:MAG: phospholipase [Leptospiraceae bacterium]|nr:phospholipase [Leptospiraceae bacterium]